MGNFDSSESYFLKNIIHNPSDTYSNFVNLANFYANFKKYDQALVYLLNAKKLNENRTQINNKIGLLFIDMNKLDTALMFFHNALELEKDDYRTWNNIGLVHNKLGEIDSAIYYSSKAIEIKPNYWLAYANRGIQYVKKGLYDKGIEELKKSVSKRPYDTTGFKYLIWAYYKKKDYVNALNDCNNIFILKPHDAEAYFLIGQVFTKLDSMQRANEMFDLATKIDSNYRYLATLHMVETYFERNEQKKGKEILNKFLNDYENFIVKVIDNDVILYNISIYLIKLGSIDVGLDCYKKTTEKNKNWKSYSKTDEDFRPVWNHPKYIEINKSR